MFVFLSFIFVLIVSTNTVLSECDFNSSKFRYELNKPNNIELISINIPKNDKWMRNFFKIYLSENPNIHPKQKKSFRAKIKVRYKF